MIRLFVFVLFISVLIACSEDESNPIKKPLDPIEIMPASVNYSSVEDVLNEESGAHTVLIILSDAAEAEGVVEITVTGDTGSEYFTTSPASSDGKILIPVTEGDTEVSFNVIPVNNAKLNGNKSAIFTITQATGSVTRGESISYAIKVLDDELRGKPKISHRVQSEFSQVKNMYEYNEDGLVSKLHWEMRTPFGITAGTEEYTYNETGEIQRIARAGTGLEKLYTWEDGVIVKLEQRIDGNVTYYNVFEYDEAGRVKNVNNFTKNVGGFFVSTMYESYSYLPDGNAYQVTLYNFRESEDAFVVNLTTTYEDYVEGHNPLPDVRPLPNQPGQTKLPTYYSKETKDIKQEYTVSYEFTPEGLLLKKNVVGASPDTGVTTYTYFD